MPSFDVIEITYGLTHIGKYIRGDSILDLDSFKNAEREAYSSPWLHSEEIEKWWSGNFKGARKSYAGSVKAEFIYFDFDSADLFSALMDTQELVKDLTVKYSVPSESLRIYFSGNKGFHVYLIDSFAFDMEPSPQVPGKIKSAAMSLAGHLKTFDTAVYQPVQLFRIPNSKHQKTGLFKIPYSVDEFLKIEPFDFEDIRALAKEPREIKYEKVVNSSGFVERLLSAPTSAKPKDNNSYAEKIKSGLSEGGRNKTLASLAGMLFRKQVDPETCAFVVSMFNEVASKPLPGSEVEKILSSIKRYHPSKISEERNKVAVMLTPHECREIYLQACKDDEEGVKFGYKIMESVFGGLHKNEILTLVASPGCVKTASMQNMGLRAAHRLLADEFVSFFSMDMKAAGEYERRSQITGGFTSRKEMRRLGKTDDLIFLSKLRANDIAAERLVSCYSHGLTVSAMRDLILRTQDARKESCRLILLDYFDKIKSSNGKAFNPVGETMQEIRDMLASDIGASVVLLVQTNKDINAKDKWDLDTRDGKGGTSLDQEPDFQMRLAWCKDFDGSLIPCGRFKKHRRFEGDKPWPFFKMIYEGKNYVIKDMVEIPEDDPLIQGKNRKEEASF